MVAPTTEVTAVRGRAKKQASMLAFIDPETLVPVDHPLRTIKRFADSGRRKLGKAPLCLRETCDAPDASGTTG